MPGGQEEMAAAVEAARKTPVISEVELSTGVILAVKPVPLFLLRKAISQLTPPRIPRVFLEDKGREEENPDDPEYKDALVQFEQKSFDVAANVLLLLGTELKHCPEPIQPLESEEWSRPLEALEIVSPSELDSPPRRYLAWLSYYVLSDPEDIARVVELVAKRSGVLESEVDTAVDSFRSRKVRRVDNRIPSEDS